MWEAMQLEAEYRRMRISEDWGHRTGWRWWKRLAARFARTENADAGRRYGTIGHPWDEQPVAVPAHRGSLEPAGLAPATAPATSIRVGDRAHRTRSVRPVGTGSEAA